MEGVEVSPEVEPWGAEKPYPSAPHLSGGRVPSGRSLPSRSAGRENEAPGAGWDGEYLFDERALRGLGSALLCPAVRLAASQVE